MMPPDYHTSIPYTKESDEVMEETLQSMIDTLPLSHATVLRALLQCCARQKDIAFVCDKVGLVLTKNTHDKKTNVRACTVS